MWYSMISDPAGWLNVNTSTGVITVRNEMDRESVFVKEERYTALIGAYDDETGIILTLNSELERGEYSVAMTVTDHHDLSQVSTVTASVCDCTGDEVVCKDIRAAVAGMPIILGILAGVLLLLSKFEMLAHF
ncbi:hypothetical protein XENOCAPTIV_021103 [Xenoophorus captivus]|uniref:Cadherin domain-containing protein n=1 Tax=Xenoophorus captivus TaxID=1517983 RepID=A0ABV0QKI7_9TELE